MSGQTASGTAVICTHRWPTASLMLWRSSPTPTPRRTPSLSVRGRRGPRGSNTTDELDRTLRSGPAPPDA